MRIRRQSRGLLAATAACASVGCADWPRWSHLPAEDDAIEAPDDLGSLIEREWVILAEAGDLPDGSSGNAPLALDLEHAARVEGALDGMGWNDLADPSLVTSPGCNDTGAARHPEVIPGDWAADVDVIVVVAPEGGQLCAEVEVDSTEVGWDLLLARLDDCGVPESFAEDADGPLGWDRGGPHGRWHAPIEAGVAYAVTLGAYFPTDLEASVAYDLGISLVTASDGGSSPCPLLPEEAAP